MLRSVRRRVGWLVGWSLFQVGLAHATGAFRADEIVVNPAVPGTMILRSNAWGFAITRDGGATGQWSCNEVFDGNSLNTTLAPMTVTDHGRLVVAGGYNGLLVSDDYCGWTKAPGFEDQYVADVAHGAGSDVYVLTSTGNDAGIHTVFRLSHDGGQTFEELTSAFPENVVVQELSVAVADPAYVYLAGAAGCRG